VIPAKARAASFEFGDIILVFMFRHIRGRPYHLMTQGKIERYQVNGQSDTEAAPRRRRAS
jgi:hypothetical protein